MSPNSLRSLANPRADRPSIPVSYGIQPAPSGEGTLPWDFVGERMHAARNYWVVSSSREGRPHAVPVWGLWLDDMFLFSTAAGSVKARNLANDSRCVVCTEHADEAAIVEGVAEELADRELLARFKDLYKEKYDWDLDIDAGGIYVVRPRVAFGFIEHSDQFAGSATRWVFE